MYFPTLCVEQNAAWNERVPYAKKWRPSKTRGITRNYRAELDAMRAHLVSIALNYFLLNDIWKITIKIHIFLIL